MISIHISGTFTIGIGTPAAVVACSIAQGACMSVCAAFAVNPVI